MLWTKHKHLTKNVLAELFETDPLVGANESKDIESTEIFNGVKTKMYMLGYPPKDMHSFCSQITNNGYEDYYVKYTF